MSFNRDIQKQNTGCLFYVMSATDSMYRKKKKKEKNPQKTFLLVYFNQDILINLLYEYTFS